MKINKPTLFTTLFIMISFLWTGSSYISWTHNLSMFYDENTVYILTEAWGGYLPQIIGIITFSFLLYKKTNSILSYTFFTAICIIDGLLIIGFIHSNSAAIVLICGILANFFHGIIAAFYLTMLALLVPKNHRGISFGCGYALGSIGSFLLSLPKDGAFLSNKYVSLAYAIIIVITIIMAKRVFNISSKKSGIVVDSMNSRKDIPVNVSLLLKIIVIPSLLILFVTLINQLMYVFPASSYLSGHIKLEYSRAFYSIGLLSAGFLNDKDRRFGPFLCLLALVFSLISLGLNDIPSVVQLLAIVGYITIGFPVVYRVICFIDVADRKYSLLPLAAIGLAIGRFGEASGAHLGLILKNHQTLLVIFSSILFIVISSLVYYMYVSQRSSIYSHTAANTSIPIIPNTLSFAEFYGLSKREIEVLELILKNETNSMIADTLFVSENTVKFHVKNILHKTECKNRKELIAKASAYK